MSDYDNQYFFIRFDNDNERAPYLQPDTNTNERRFRNKAPGMGSSPLVFTNAWKEDFRKAGVKEEIADILFESSLFVVRDSIRERLLQYQIPNMFMHPAVYIADSGDWHEDYWFVGFTARYDCWDRATSKYKSPPVQIGTKEFYSMYSYSLDKKILDATPLESRLLFQMGGTDDAMVVCHQSVASMFRGNGASGALLQPIVDY